MLQLWILARAVAWLQREAGTGRQDAGEDVGAAVAKAALLAADFDGAEVRGEHLPGDAIGLMHCQGESS